MELYCIKTINKPVLSVFVDFDCCAVERGVLRVRAVGGSDGIPFCGANWMGVVWRVSDLAGWKVWGDYDFTYLL
jgi:hypothetical protein